MFGFRAKYCNQNNRMLCFVHRTPYSRFFIVEWINEKCSFLIDYSGNVVFFTRHRGKDCTFKRTEWNEVSKFLC